MLTCRSRPVTRSIRYTKGSCPPYTALSPGRMRSRCSVRRVSKSGDTRCAPPQHAQTTHPPRPVPPSAVQSSPAPPRPAPSAGSRSAVVCRACGGRCPGSHTTAPWYAHHGTLVRTLRHLGTHNTVPWHARRASAGRPWAGGCTLASVGPASGRAPARTPPTQHRHRHRHTKQPPHAHTTT